MITFPETVTDGDVDELIVYAALPTVESKNPVPPATA